MDRLKWFLSFCSIISVFAVLGIGFDFLRAVWRRLSSCKTPIPWKDFNLFYGLHETGNFVSILIVTIGLLNLFCSSYYASTEIGSFYEKSSYEENYEAYIYAGDKRIFCIATIGKEDGSYHLTKIEFPYGRSQYVDETYEQSDLKNGHTDVSLTDGAIRCDIELKEPATEDSYERLKTEVVSKSGEFCGSKKSDSYHFKKCRCVKNIKAQNLVYFGAEEEARALGYFSCAVCGS